MPVRKRTSGAGASRRDDAEQDDDDNGKQRRREYGHSPDGGEFEDNAAPPQQSHLGPPVVRQGKDNDEDGTNSSSGSSSSADSSCSSDSWTSSTSSISSMSSSAPTDVVRQHARKAGISGDSKRKKGFREKYLPASVYHYGRTVYGGNPIAQQTLPGIFNYVSPFIMIPIFFAFMVPFIVVGAIVVSRSRNIYRVEVRYSDINKYQYIPDDPTININQGIRSFTADGVTQSQGTVTWATFNVTKRMKQPVYMYYKITNFFQNHRDFHDGRSTGQLKGNRKIGSSVLCKPFKEPGYVDRRGESLRVNVSGTILTQKHLTYNPCGLAAWSFFNDTLQLYRVVNTSVDDAILGGANGELPLELVCNGTDFDTVGNTLGHSVQPNHCKKKDISWRADRNVRFKPLEPQTKWWSLRYPVVTDNVYLNNGWYLDEPGHSLPDPMNLDFQVWMKSAVLPHFRKLYRIIEEDLEPGTYAVKIDEFFDVVSFKGAKYLVLRTGNWIGDTNIGIGVVFLVIGGLSFVLGVAFTIEFCLRLRGKSPQDKLDEPKRSWYVFDPQSHVFETYYKMRLERHIPMAELMALRKMQDVPQDSD